MNAPLRTRSKGVRTLSPWGSYHAVPADALLPYPVAQSLRDRTVFLWLRRCPVCLEAKPLLAKRKCCGNSCKGILISITASDTRTTETQEAQHERTKQRAELADLERILRDGLDVVAAYRIGRRRGYRLGETRGACRERRAWEEGRR